MFAKLTSPQLNKTWLVLGAALAIGLLAAFIARGYLSSRLAEIDAKAKGKTVNLVVAKRDLKRGERITEESAAVRPIPLDYAHTQAVTPDNFERIDGQPLAYPVKSGEMILWSMLEGKKTPTFSTRVVAGRRAVTLPVDEISSISGMLEPGDIVDLMTTVGQQGKKYSYVALQGVTVLATGQRAQDDPRSGERKTYSTVTLDLSPEQAQVIVNARETGKLTALLRNPQDKTAIAINSRANSFAQELAGDPGQIPVIYGGRSAKIAPEALHLGSRGHGDIIESQSGVAEAAATSASSAAQIMTGQTPHL